MKRPATEVLKLATVLLALAGSACSEPPPAPVDAAVDAAIDFVPRGHREVVVLDDGSLRPRWIGSRRSFGGCLDPPLAVDTSRWQMRFRFDGEAAVQTELEDPFIVAGTALCFGQHIEPSTASSAALEVCGELVNSFSGEPIELPCFIAAYDAEEKPYLDLRGRAAELIVGRAQLTREAYIEALDELTAVTESRGYPLLAVYLQLNAIDLLVADGELAAARSRLDALPPWLSRPEAAAKHALALYQRARIEELAGRPRQAWELLSRAEEKARRCGSNKRIAVTVLQAQILSRLEVGKEPLRRLSETLDETSWPSDRSIVPLAREMRAWLVLTDPDVDDQVLDAVAGDLAAAATDTVGRHAREQANLWINQALLKVRRGQSPAADLERARQRLGEMEPSPRGRFLLRWADVVAGLDALEQSDPEAAHELCARAAGSMEHPRLAARAWSCLGRARADLGRPAAAAEAFEQALVRDEMAADTLGQAWPVAPGWRADDYYRAARAAVELGDAEHAWELLAAFDRRAVEVGGCADREPADRERHQRRRQRLLDELALTEPPFSAARQRQIRPIRRSLLRALEQLDRTLLADCGEAARAAAPPAHLRAVPLDDEILLLRRLDDGRVEVARRTAISRTAVRSLIEELEAARENGDLDDSAWRRRAAPLSTALLPVDTSSLPEVTRFALHGLLQRAPLAALPVADDGRARWLHELTAPVLRPAGAAKAGAAPVGAPLFVVDPQGDLPSGAAGADLYARLFPTARILHGGAAGRGAVIAALGSASFLHADAHGRHEPAFPRLSGLEMSDGALTVADFQSVEVALDFANLSGCHTGKATVTGDSGRYGLAGALAARGVPFVVASDTAIEDRVLADFNGELYPRIAAGLPVPAAFTLALASVRDRHPAAAWAGLQLVGTAPPVAAAGQRQSSPDYGTTDEGVDDGT